MTTILEVVLMICSLISDANTTNSLSSVTVHLWEILWNREWPLDNQY